MDLDAYTKRLARDMVDALNSRTKRRNSLSDSEGEKNHK